MVSVNLGVALKLTHCENEELVLLKEPNKENEIISIKRIKEKYDMKKMKVVRIDSWFMNGDYMGFEFLLEEK